MKRNENVDAERVWNHIVETYAIGQEVSRPVGRVLSALGVFVSLEEGFDALIHVSKISGLCGQDPRRYFVTGQMVTAKIININQQTRRVELATDLCSFSFDGFLSKEEQVVVPDTNLCDLDVTSGTLFGAWVCDRPEARPELIARTETEMSFQLQAKCPHYDRQALKAVHVILRQDGKDVKGCVDWAACTAASHDYGYDLADASTRNYTEESDEGGVPVAVSEDLTSEDSQGYGCVKLCFRRRPVHVESSLTGVLPCAVTEVRKTILVDGNNIIRTWPRLRSEALDILVQALKANGYEPVVFFDATIKYVLQNSADVFGQSLLSHMREEAPEDVVVVPAGTRADDYMLLLADRRGYSIVSCDTYRDEAFARYSWLRNSIESGEKRVHAPAFCLNDLVIPTLGIVWSVAPLYSEKSLSRGDVFIRACGNNQYFCAENDATECGRPFVANRDNASAWEMFAFARNPDGTFSVKAKVNDKFVSTEIETDGRLVCRADDIRESEKFWVVRRAEDGCFALRSCVNMRYVCVEPESGQAYARAESPNEWSWVSVLPCI